MVCSWQASFLLPKLGVRCGVLLAAVFRNFSLIKTNIPCKFLRDRMGPTRRPSGQTNICQLRMRLPERLQCIFVVCFCYSLHCFARFLNCHQLLLFVFEFLSLSLALFFLSFVASRSLWVQREKHVPAGPVHPSEARQIRAAKPIHGRNHAIIPKSTSNHPSIIPT